MPKYMSQFQSLQKNEYNNFVLAFYYLQGNSKINIVRIGGQNAIVII